VPDPGLGAAPEPVRPTGPDQQWRALQGRSLIRLLPVLLIVVAVLYDILTPRYFTAAPLYTAAPLVAAPLYSRRGTALTGAAVVAAVIGLQLTKGVIHYVDSLTELITIATVAALAVFVNAFVRRTGERLVSVREIAEAAQRAVLPEPAERIGGFEIAACYEAAQADAFIGGDLYAVQDSARGIRLIVGDVRGKGMGAVAAVAVVIGAFREAAEQEATLEAVAQRLERALAREGTRRDGLDAFEGFTTAVLAELPHGDGVVRIVNRGHPPPLLLYADGTLCPLPARESALPLGMGELGVWPDRADEAAFPGGATLLLYTDGLSEARDARGEFYDPQARLAGRVFRHPTELLDTLAEDVRRHSEGGMADDMALLAVRRP
jgi:serine phosphatase RsbU (regulator of sigma subunit)